MDKQNAWILWLDQLSNDDVGLVGGKNASLGEMYTQLIPKGIKIPNAFVVTSNGYKHFVQTTGLAEKIKSELAELKIEDVHSLQETGKSIREAFLSVNFPEDLAAQVRENYRHLCNDAGVENIDTAVRSSATAEDLPGASFAGEHETFLNVSGDENVLNAIKGCFASLFTDRAISYRVDKGFDHLDIYLSVGIQRMVHSDRASSGVMFSLDTESGFRDVVQITSAWGLGEMVVQGKVVPDEFMVYKPSLKRTLPGIIKKNLGPKATKMIYDTSENAERPVKEVDVPAEDRKKFSISDDEVLTLARWAVAIEDHYTERAGKDMPMDMEWAKDGVSGELYIVQARPETVQAEKKGFIHEEYQLQETGEIISEGISVGTKIATGKAKIILSTGHLDEFNEGEILFTEITDPDWEPIMKKASAIVTEKGGRTSHAAIVSRELGIPAVVGAEGVLDKIKTGDEVTIDTSSGDVGKIYSGTLKFDKKVYELNKIPEIKTKIAMNIGTPDGAFMHSKLPHKGVGLAREEFIIASQIQVHPNALLNYDQIQDEELKRKIDDITAGYESKTDFYVHKLAQGIAQIGAAFAPEQVIVRFSDFKTNEYRALLGGDLYEPKEENPMLGWRGASRYYHKDFKDAFKLECQAIKIVREEFGLTNVQVMVPFCRTPEEGKKVVEVVEEAGLKRGDGEHGLKIYVMCEIPTNVIRADDFLEIFDGFSIGSNDLAQLTLGMDRDSSVISGISNENDKAVKSLVSRAIKICHEKGKYIGFCGQAPSDYPEFFRFLVSQGIDTISLNPDSVIPMILEAEKVEAQIGNNE